MTWLVDQVPELRPVLDEHVAYNGELLSYVAFEGEFLRWFVDRVRVGDHEPARRFVVAIELLMTTDVEPPADDRVWNLAGVCFVEGLVMQGFWDDVIQTARPWMGPNTIRDIDQMFRYRRARFRQRPKQESAPLGAMPRAGLPSSVLAGRSEATNMRLIGPSADLGPILLADILVDLNVG